MQYELLVLTAEELADFWIENNQKAGLYYYDQDTYPFMPWCKGEKMYYVVLIYQNIIFGILKLKTKGYPSINFSNYKNWVMYISVRKEYQGKGFAKIMIKKAFDFLKEKGEDHLLFSAFSEQGIYLVNFVNKIKKDYPELNIISSDGLVE